MLPSKKFISMPIISLKEGQRIGYVRNLVIDPKSRAVAALIVDPRRFFIEQRIIPFNRVVSIGENAITVSTESQVEKASNLPDIMNLLKEKAAVVGIKVLTANGKTLGMVDEFYISRKDGRIQYIDISGGKVDGLFHGKARLNADEIVTLGTDVMVVTEDSEQKLEIFTKGINDNLKSIFQTASGKISKQGEKLNNWKNMRKKTAALETKLPLEEPGYPAVSNTDPECNEKTPPILQAADDVYPENDCNNGTDNRTDNEIDNETDNNTNNEDNNKQL